MAGVAAFREAYFSADATDADDFTAYAARRLRYQLLWSAYENTLYRDVHTWAPKLRADYGLYKYIRGIYNPAYRLGKFYATHLMGGSLDMEAGDGQGEPSALPIITDNDALRPAIAQLWKWSNWQKQKTTWTRNGAILGDIGLLVCDDVARGKVYLKVLHPSIVKELVMDDQGNVKGYIFEEERPDPRLTTSQQLATREQEERYTRPVVYTEIAERDGENVIYTTLLDKVPYPWNGTEASWVEPYGFIPLVMVQHTDVGLDWGQSVYHNTLGKIREADDLASKLHDQVRKMVDAPWLFSGVSKPSSTPTITNSTASTTRPEPGREEVPALYANAGATATPLVAPLDIAATSSAIKEVLAELERDHPELRSDIATASGDASGRALRVARQAAEAEVLAARVNYDDGLMRAIAMALTIGGHRGYPEFAGISLDSYHAGDMDFQIGKRPVFAVDPLDDLEVDQAFWTVAGLATAAGVPLELHLEDAGWAPERVAKIAQAKQQRQQQALQIARTQRGRAVAETVDAADQDAQTRARALLEDRGGMNEQPPA